MRMFTTLSPFAHRIVAAWLFGILLLALTGPSYAHAAQLPSCVVGTFRLTSFDGLVRTAFPEVASGSVSLVSGEGTSTHQANGAYENTYRQLTVAALVADIPITMTFDGWERGTVRETGPGSLNVATSDFSLAITISTEGRSETVNVAGPTGITTDVTYECRGNSLISESTIPSADGSPPVRIRTEEVRIN